MLPDSLTMQGITYISSLANRLINAHYGGRISQGTSAVVLPKPEEQWFCFSHSCQQELTKGYSSKRWSLNLSRWLIDPDVYNLFLVFHFPIDATHSFFRNSIPYRLFKKHRNMVTRSEIVQMPVKHESFIYGRILTHSVTVELSSKLTRIKKNDQLITTKGTRNF